MDSIFKGRRTLSIMPTYTCPAACSSCGTLSSPREKTNLDTQSIKKAILQAKDLDFYNVVFTGGEATLRWDDLLDCIEFAANLNFPTRLVTNAHWARNFDYAERRIDALINSGLSEINYSTGDEHVRFIPITRVIIASVVAAKRNLPVHVMVEYKKERTISRGDVLTNALITDLPDEVRSLIKVIESPWMPLDHTVREEYTNTYDVLSKENLTLKKGCDNILQTYTIQADGNIAACCGLGMRLIPELQVGTVSQKDLASVIEESESDFLKLWIHYAGPEKILAWAASKDNTIEWENIYAHHCQVCQRIYKDPKVVNIIRQYHEEVIADVLHSIWIDEEYLPQRVRDFSTKE